jgi:hypothetical protein
VTERRSGSSISEKGKPELRFGFFSGIGITDTTHPSPIEFWVTLCVPGPILFRKITLRNAQFFFATSSSKSLQKIASQHGRPLHHNKTLFYAL